MATRTPAIPTDLRLKLHLVPLLAVLILSVYGQVVCPFLADLSLWQLVAGLSLIAAIHIALREMLFHHYNRQEQYRSAPAWIAQRASVISWLLAGVAASVFHILVYPDFPPESHLKLLTGYWALGAGILSQVDHLVVEDYFRKQGIRALGDRVERISRRLMYSIAVFTLVPGLVMTVMAFRFVYEGYAEAGIAYEVGFLSVLFFAFAITVARKYGRALRRDTRDISKALRKISDGEFRVELDTTRPDELGLVAQGINQMARGLVLRERIRDLFGRFVHPDIAEKIIRDFGDDSPTGDIRHTGQKRKVAVLMSDIRGFTTLAEHMDPEKLVQLLNGYFAEMVEAIQSHGGIVDKFVGDAVMGVFGLDSEDDAENVCRSAVAAAQNMRERLKGYSEYSERAYGVALENGVGIHFGEVVAGYLGCDQRLEFTVIGTTVNTAARVEGECRAPNPPVLYTSEVADHVPGSRKVTAVSLKGLSQPVDLYTCQEAGASSS